MPETALISPISSRELAVSTATVMADIVRLLVHRPDRVHMKICNDVGKVILRVRVAPDDLGKVIGKQGRTVRSLRMVLSSISSKTGVHFELDIHAEQT